MATDGRAAPQHTQRVLVWFNNDLRLDDHPGVAAAAEAAGGAAFLYCFDPDSLSALIFYPGGLQVLVWAVQRLRQQLLAAGSDLIVRVGSWASVVPEVAAAVGAGTVLVERDVESSSQAGLEAATLQLQQQGVKLQAWDLAAWDRARLDTNFRRWKAARGGCRGPVDAPAKLPAAVSSVDSGTLPTVEMLQAMLGSVGLQEENKTLLEAAEKVAATAAAPKASREAWLLEQEAAAGASALDLLDCYLRQGRGGAASSPVAELLKQEAVGAETPAAEGAAFQALFGWQLRFGVLSRRRVLQRCSQVGGAGWFTGPATPHVAATASTERSEFHHQLLACEATVKASVPVPGLQPQAWRWRNSLADYCEGHPSGGPHPESPAVLLLHGFGAFGAHWRFNVEPLTAEGYHVYAPTLPGFGRTEKATMVYSQELWSSYLRDFVLHKVRKPVVLAGNSIGGFIAASFAAEYPELVRGLVLVNAAGPINPRFSADAWASQVRTPPPAWLAFSLSYGLFWYLERSVQGTLKWLYPKNPGNADQWLTGEIVRAAADSGALDVFKAVFYLPPPRALNYLVKDLYKGPTMVLQGADDPLNDARARARQLDELCPNVSIKLIEAGHCPHDELPDTFNPALLEFLKSLDESAAGSAAAELGSEVKSSLAMEPQ